MRKIIHVDMDCFFAAVEIRDNPALRFKPVAIGGRPGRRGVLSTCNYIARKFGLHSAMPTGQALKLCPNLVLLSGNMEKYKRASKTLYRIFRNYTPKVEMLSLDEGFLDVTESERCKGSATLMAQTIKRRVKKELGLIASAGVAPNKFLAKVASDWKKPDGLFVITPDMVDDFVAKLPVEKIFGVGKVTAAKLHKMQITTCADLQELSLLELSHKFGKMGERLFDLCRGIDEREVEAERVRKSLSVEKTFVTDLQTFDEVIKALPNLITEFTKRLSRVEDLVISGQFVKIKFYDFKQTTVAKVSNTVSEEIFRDLLQTGWDRQQKAVRLLGIGVKFV